MTDPRAAGRTDGWPLPEAELPWQEWLKRHFPAVCDRPFGVRHERLWGWFGSLKQGSAPPPKVEIWPRGGAKSTTTELGVAWCGVRLARRYVLYVSETQEQADKHVGAIADYLLEAGVERAVSVYGHAKGWRRQELRTANGFNVSALGLDTAARGVKLGQYRPDLIIFDDIDNEDDSERKTKRKTRSITTKIIPAGASGAAYLFVQNMVLEDGIFAQLYDGRADFLHNREPAFLEPAVRGLTYRAEDRGDGLRKYVVTGGVPTWEGQNLAVVESQIAEWGLEAFLREAQHDVGVGSGYVFDVAQLRRIKPTEVPPFVGICLAGDLAATEGAGDWTALPVLGKAKNETFYVLGVVRGQWASHRVRGAIRLSHGHYQSIFPHLKLHLPQDPGQAGKDQAQQMQAAFPGAQIEAVTGKKAARASGFASQVNLGNVFLVDQDLPEWVLEAHPKLGDELIDIGGKPLMASRAFAEWQRAFTHELRRFREDELDQVDDQVDAASDAFNELAGPVGWARNPQALAKLAQHRATAAEPQKPKPEPQPEPEPEPEPEPSTAEPLTSLRVPRR